MEGKVKKLFTTFNTLTVLMLSVGLMAFITACEGPEGPQGPQGPAGDDGQDGATTCMECHNFSTDLVAKIMNYEESGHYTGTSYVRGSIGSCAACHSSEGFTMWAAGEEVTGIATPTPVGCRTCHNIHKTYTEEDYDLTYNDPVSLIGDMTNGETVDLGAANLCVACHQSRDRGYGLENGGDVEISSSHWGPHLGTQTNTLMGVGGYETAGGAYNNSAHTTMITDGCVSCHMFNENHTFEADIAYCETCHDDIESFDYDGVQTQVAQLMDELKDHLIAEGLAAEEDEEVHPVAGVTTSADKAGALFNYFLLVDDGSYGVHNPRYITALLDNSIAVFN